MQVDGLRLTAVLNTIQTKNPSLEVTPSTLAQTARWTTN